MSPDFRPPPPPPPEPPPLHVKITREPFGDYFTFTLDDGRSEELEPDDARAWLKTRGADPDAAEKVLDHVWNLYEAEFTIKKPKQVVVTDRLRPQV